MPKCFSYLSPQGPQLHMSKLSNSDRHKGGENSCTSVPVSALFPCGSVATEVPHPMMTDKEDQGSHQSVSPEMVAVDHIWMVACDSVKEVKHCDTNRAPKNPLSSLSSFVFCTQEESRATSPCSLSNPTNKVLFPPLSVDCTFVSV